MTDTGRQKVLYLITKSNWGGAQRYVYDLATSLDQTRFEPVVVLGGDGVLKTQLEHAHIRTITIDSLQRDVSLKKEVAFITELRKIIKIEKPAVLHVNSSKAGAVGTALGRLMCVPRVIFTAHGWAFNERRPWWQKVILKGIHWFTVLCSHKTIAVSNAIVNQLQWPLIKKRFIVINPGRTIGPMYGKIEARNKLSDRFPVLKEHLNKKWILTIAELHPIKRQDVLVTAMQSVIKNHPNAVAIIIGDGEQRVKLEKQITNTNLQEHVFLVGAVTEAARFLKATDIFTLTSDSESYGYVIHEAGIAGVPVVATNVGGVTDMITDNTRGTLIPAGSSPDLSVAINEILANPTLAKEKATTLQSVLNTRTKAAMTSATEAVYELALK